MPIYINKNNQQSGPYEDHVVIEQLRNGMLSPDDLGIRHGGTTWRRLGEMFPDAVPLRAAAPPVASAVGGAVSASAQPARLAEKSAGGGCRQVLGIIMLVVGILTLLAGAGVSIVTPSMYYAGTCEMAEADKKTVVELMKQYEAAKGTDKEISIQYELERELKSWELSNDACGRQMSDKRFFQLISIVVAVIGFFMAVIGFFVRRV